MKEVYLFRSKTSDQGTEGLLLSEDFFCKTLELPWRGNKRNISCIPSGEYKVIIRKSPKYGKVYWITNVEDRSWILIHSGNVAGDISKGLKSHVNGCILLGKKHGWLWNQRAVLTSKPTIRKFRNIMKDKPFILKIIGDLNEEFFD